MTELHETYSSIMHAVCAEDVFGEIGGQTEEERLKSLLKSFRWLSKAVHPDRFADNLDEKEMAGEAFCRLKEFHDRAVLKVKDGTYGSKAEARETVFTIATKKRQYAIFRSLAEGDIASLFEGECVGSDDFAGKIAVKIVRDPADNDFMQKEQRVLKMFAANPSAQSKHFPVLLDEFRTSEGKVASVLRHFDGLDFYTIRELSRYQDGVPAQHAAWILDRILSAIGRAHLLGTTHNYLNPSHLLVRPRDHNVLVADWCYASVNPRLTGDGFKVYDEEFSAPEALEKRPPIPASDIFSIGKCLVYLLGGDVKTNKIPDTVEEKFRRFVEWMVFTSPFQRPQDAWETHAMLISLRKELWGPIRFLELKI